MKFEILDWAGNGVYSGQTFANWQVANDFLVQDQRQRHPEVTEDELNDILGEFYIVPMKPE